jgi:mRNA interferase RelE/StbE
MSTANEPYRVELARAAVKALGDLPARDRDRIVGRIAGLAADPRPRGATKLTDAGGLYRLRVGDYRVIYAIDDAARLVTVADVGNRRDIYRG